MVYIHNTELVTPMISMFLLVAGRQPADEFLSLSLLPGRFGKRIPPPPPPDTHTQAADLSLFPSLLFSDS